MEFQYQSGDETIAVRVEKSGTGYSITIGERTMTVEGARLHDGELRLTLDGRVHSVYVATDGPRRWVSFDSQTFLFTMPQAEKKARRGHGSGPRHDALEAQMPGVVRQVLVAVGETVERGQALVVLEAMKMEIRVAAPHAGVVEKVAVREGETVQRGQLLAELLERD